MFERFINKDEIVMVAEIDDAKSKEEHIKDYIKSIKAIEEAMEPYKEQKRDLKKDYLEKKWLSREDISLAVKAYRLLKEDIDVGLLIDMYEQLKEKKEG